MPRNRLADAHQTIRDLRNQLAESRAPFIQRLAESEAREASLRDQVARLTQDLADHQHALVGLVSIAYRRLASGKPEVR